MGKGKWNRVVHLVVEPDRPAGFHIELYLENTTQTLSKCARETKGVDDINLTEAEAEKRWMKAFRWACGK